MERRGCDRETLIGWLPPVCTPDQGPIPPAFVVQDDALTNRATLARAVSFFLT